MVLTISIGVEVKFDGNGFLEIEIPKAYYGKVRKTPGSLRRGVSLQGTECPTGECPTPHNGKKLQGGGTFLCGVERGCQPQMPPAIPGAEDPSFPSAYPDLWHVWELQR